MFANGHLNLQFACMLIVYLIWLSLIIPVRYAQNKEEGGIDNNNPRIQYTKLPALAQRSIAAHNNTMESFIFFSFALIVNVIGGGSLIAGDILSILFLICRIGYCIAYIMDYPTIRTSIWAIGALSNFILFLIPFATSDSSNIINFNNFGQGFRSNRW